MTKLSTGADFENIIRLIEEARRRAFAKVNEELIKLYFEVGRIVFARVEAGNWGEKTVDELAEFIRHKMPETKGFTRRGLYRMKQFYETYCEDSECFKMWLELRSNESDEIVSALPTQFQTQQNQENTFIKEILSKVSWTNHLEILAATKKPEERLFYLISAASENWTMREIRRQIKSALYERTMLSNQNVSALRSQNAEKLLDSFKDPYIFEFLELPEQHSEKDLQTALVENFRRFILELGKGFTYMGKEFRLQVGNHDYYLDLLFFHRDLQCLVLFELKIAEFKPEFLGKLNFYLEALDTDIKRPFENPSIGVLLCKGKDKEVVRYALARNVSPAVIAEYETKLIDRHLLVQKLNELTDLFGLTEREDK